MSLDRQRIDAVKLLQEQGYTYSPQGGWVKESTELEKLIAGAKSVARILNALPVPYPVAPPIQHYCGHCGSSHVRSDGWLEWDVAKQAWVAGDCYDNTDCEICAGETTSYEAPASDFADCQKCGNNFHLDHLDAKPDPAQLAAGIPRDGCDFTVLECEKCYGPGYSKV